jgi:hypothetical protein
MWDIVWFLIKIFLQGFAVGCIIRIIVALLFRSDVTFNGLFWSGFIFGLLYLIIKFAYFATAIVP